MQHSLSNVLQYFEEAAQLTDNVYFVFDINTNEIRYVNAALEHLWQRSTAEIAEKPDRLLENIHEEDKEYVIKTYKNLLKNGNKEQIEFRLSLPDDKVKWLFLRAVKLENKSNDAVFVGVIADISKEKEHTDLLERYAAKKNSVLEILSHDLAGPLTSIKGASSFLADKVKEYKDPSLENLVDIITRTSERSIHLIREFVKQEFLASANTTTSRRRVDIVEKIKESMEQYKSSEEKIEKNFKFNPSKEKIYLKIDDYKFIQVINNLISNSIKFTPDGGTISLTVEEKPEHVLFIVADDGIGIPYEFHDTLFEKFNKARRPGLKGEPSVGLGMSLVKTIVEWHNGRIWFESEEGKGTTFYIEIPNE